jgi:selenium metabolism protein YedF
MNMNKSIDARGMQCPMPVIETKKALQGMTEGTVEVVVDNSIAVQNLMKMAKQKQLECSSVKIDNDNYEVQIKVTNKLTEEVPVNDKTAVEQNAVSTSGEVCYPDSREEHTVIVLSTDHMGEGDDKLGKTLMKGSIYALSELEQLPQKIILYNGGAKLSVEGSDSLEDLKLLESQGVDILTCGTCLNYYEISEKLSVGSVTNMYSIAEIMMAATKIIKP